MPACGQRALVGLNPQAQPSSAPWACPHSLCDAGAGPRCSPGAGGAEAAGTQGTSGRRKLPLGAWGSTRYSTADMGGGLWSLGKEGHSGDMTPKDRLPATFLSCAAPRWLCCEGRGRGGE